MQDMIDVEVKPILSTRQIMETGQVTISISNGSVLSDLLDNLVERWGNDLEQHLFDPETHALWPHINIMVNGRHFAFTGRMKTPLKQGDSVLIMPPAGGGA